MAQDLRQGRRTGLASSTSTGGHLCEAYLLRHDTSKASVSLANRGHKVVLSVPSCYYQRPCSLLQSL